MAIQRITLPVLVNRDSTLGSTLVVGPGASTWSAIHPKVHVADRFGPFGDQQVISPASVPESGDERSVVDLSLRGHHRPPVVSRPHNETIEQVDIAGPLFLVYIDFE